MGLDMYLFRFKKSHIPSKELANRMLEDLMDEHPELTFFTNIRINDPMYESVKKYLTKVKIQETVLNVDAVFKDNNLKFDEAHISGYGHTNKGIELFVTHNTDNSKSKTILIDYTNTKYQKIISRTVYYCEKTEVFY